MLLRCKDYGRHQSYTWASNSIDLARSLIWPSLATASITRGHKNRLSVDWLLCLSVHQLYLITAAARSENRGCCK